MPPKTPAVLLSSGASIAGFFGGTPSAGAACRHSHLHPQQPHLYTRAYAQHAQQVPNPPSHSHYGNEADLTWPVPVPPNRTPTPYEILAIRHGDPYTKHRFYALAKLYHPDRCHASSPVAHVPHAERLERYRLVVAAHGILSDDSKRRAYDVWGLGWTDHHRANSPAQYPFRTWAADNDPFHNATWEDWERWHRRNDPNGQAEDERTVYMSNFGFMSLIFLVVSFGGIVQGTRANLMTSSIMDQREKAHKTASLELARSKRATMMTGDREERVRTFLEHREANITGEPAYQRLLPPADNCSPDSVRRG